MPVTLRMKFLRRRLGAGPMWGETYPTPPLFLRLPCVISDADPVHRSRAATDRQPLLASSRCDIGNSITLSPLLRYRIALATDSRSMATDKDKDPLKGIPTDDDASE